MFLLLLILSDLQIIHYMWELSRCVDPILTKMARSDTNYAIQANIGHGEAVSTAPVFHS